MYLQFSSHQELTTIDQPGQPRRVPVEQVRSFSLLILTLRSGSLEFKAFCLLSSSWWKLPALPLSVCLVSSFTHLTSFFFLSFSPLGEIVSASLSPGTAAQPYPLNNYSQSALSYHGGCAAPSVFPPWLCREDRHLPEVSWSAFNSVSTLHFSLCSSFLPMPGSSTYRSATSWHSYMRQLLTLVAL